MEDATTSDGRPRESLHVPYPKGKFNYFTESAVLLMSTNRQYGRIRGNKSTNPPTDSYPPPNTTRLNPCKSQVCRDHLLSVLGELNKANQAMRTLAINMEEDRVESTRHIQHLRALRTYQLAKGKLQLTPIDVEDLLFEAGDGAVLEIPSDIDMQDNPSARASSSGAGSSVNRSRTPQSLSMNGYSDSDSDYIPK